MARKNRTAKTTDEPNPRKPTTELEATREAINQHHGEGTLLTARNMPEFCVIPTGVFILDLALFGGWQEGVAHMVYGFESAGKTHLLLKAVAEFQRKHPKKWVVWIATEGEGSFDKRWAEKNGVDLDRLEINYPKTGEQGVDVLIAMMDTLEVGLVVADSLPGFVPKRIIDKSAQEDTQGELARLLSKLNSKILISWADQRTRGHRVTVFFVNQYRYKLGTFVMGDGRTLPGGRQINHMPNTKLRLAADKTAKKGGSAKKESEGDNEAAADGLPALKLHRWKLEKVRFPENIGSGEYMVNFAPNHPHLQQGQSDDVETVLTYAKKYGLIEGGGNRWRIPAIGERVFANKEAIIAHLRGTELDLAQLERATIAKHREFYELAAFPPDGYLVAPVVLATPSIEPAAARTSRRRR